MVQKMKKALREKLLKKRDALTKEEVQQKSEAIMERLLSHQRFKEAKIIGFYIPKGNEVDTKKMIEAARKAGKTICAPATDHKITFYPFESFDELKKGKYDIPEPETQNTEPVEPQLILVPGVSFGLCMHRLGYGKGYYDAYLAKSFAYRLGICYDFQVLESHPKHENDQRMDEIITEKRTIQL